MKPSFIFQHFLHRVFSLLLIRPSFSGGGAMISRISNTTKEQTKNRSNRKNILPKINQQIYDQRGIWSISRIGVLTQVKLS